MAIRTITQIITDAIAFITGVQPNISTRVGTVTRDVVIESPAQEFANIYTELDQISTLQTITSPDTQTIDELNQLANNYSLVRNPGTASTGTVTFRIVNLSTNEANISIPAGTTVTTQQTSTTAVVSFTTNILATFISANAPAYFNGFTGFYELTVPITATTVGGAENVNAGAISILATSISRIFSVTNTVATTGGTDQESNDSLAHRIQLALAGNNLGTVNGIMAAVLANPNALDVTVVGPNDPEMLRNEFGGSVDIYVLGTNYVTITDTDTFTVSGPRTFIVAHQPAVTTSGSMTVTGVVGGNLYPFIPGTDFSIVADPTILENGSVFLQNGIKFLNGGTLPDDSTQIQITYTYNQLIENLQTTFDADSNHIVGADLMVKQATATLIDVVASIVVIPGFTAADVISQAQTNVTSFINTNTLGNSFNQSKIVAVIEDTPGVSEVDLTTLQFKQDDIPVTTQTITIDKTQYAVANIINLTSII